MSPVIILYDNDTGAKAIRSAIKSVSKVQVTGAEAYVHVVENLYAVPTPLSGGAEESKIEDCFDVATKSTVIDGKTYCFGNEEAKTMFMKDPKAFNVSNDFDVSKHYSKKIFAHRVVGQKADAIDFTGFRPLLTNLVAAIHGHKTAKGLQPTSV